MPAEEPLGTGGRGAPERSTNNDGAGYGTYCLVLGDGPTTYGGLESISADTIAGVQVVTVTLTVGAAAELVVEPMIELAVYTDKLRTVLPDLSLIWELGPRPGG